MALDLRTSKYLSINKAGAILWPHLIEGADRRVLSERLVDEFGIDETAAARDVEKFISLLEAQDLLES